MKSIFLILILSLSIGFAQGQDLFKGKSEKAYVLKFKNEDKMQAGKQSAVKWLKDTQIEIRDGGKTILVNNKSFQKKELHYLSDVDKIYGLDQYDDYSWNKEQNWQFNYEVVDSNFYVVITQKLGKRFQMTVFHLGDRHHYFELLKKNCLLH
ncbi:hypothetical protein [Marinifilum sp. D737]|uniref:hypothetical protein n=1 Tax=Marinifilum sp. D737 TaxID=2969628 RepID=UPI0022747934|nr:hypothetical protein [Marinifilum sp. D737]MCY1634996.1 hypothetical protein [Marinifilum sp. D737]